MGAAVAERNEKPVCIDDSVEGIMHRASSMRDVEEPLSYGFVRIHFGVPDGEAEDTRLPEAITSLRQLETPIRKDGRSLYMLSLSARGYRSIVDILGENPEFVRSITFLRNNNPDDPERVVRAYVFDGSDVVRESI